MAKKPPIWQLPAIIGGVVLGLGATGTGIVKFAQFLTITDRLEAAESRNAEQDQALNKLSYIAEQNQAILDRLTQHAPNPSRSEESRLQEWWDDQGRRWTCDPGRYDCANPDNWFRDS